MNFRRLSLRIRIFLAMILLILMAYVLIAIVTLFQYEEQKKEYNASRFERKEDATRLNISYEFNDNKLTKTTQNIPVIFKHSIFQIASVHKMNVKMYDLEGNLLVTSELNKVSSEKISETELNEIKKKINHRLILPINEKGETLQVSYAYIYDNDKKPICILKLYYLQDNSFQDKDLEEFLYRLGGVYLVVFLVAIFFAYFLSSYITKSINTVITKMSQTGLDKKNEKIFLQNTSTEIKKLLQAYNNMVDELELSAVKLAKSEREQAWREMAKQVAHEIKNPLTPMRLTVQSFERRFNPEDLKIKEKLKEYSDTLIQQIDIMSSIATAFSDFAQMPSQRKELIDAVAVIKKALDIFEDRNIEFEFNTTQSFILVDKSQLVRVVTNLIKNAIHAVEEIDDPKIKVSLVERDTSFEIRVKDNGKGIEEELKNLIFQPRFTTKTSGMGLGLAMSKKIIETYNGEIVFDSEVGKGTEFTITIPKE
jgi:signal transduction histidine kinase